MNPHKYSCRRSVYYFYRQNGTIEKYPEGFEKNIIMTYMFLGRMYSKLTSQEKDQLIRTQSASLHCYRVSFFFFHDTLANSQKQLHLLRLLS